MISAPPVRLWSTSKIRCFPYVVGCRYTQYCCSKRRFPEASHGRVSSHIDRHRSLKSSFPELSEKYWVDRCAVSPKRAISYTLELPILLQIKPYSLEDHDIFFLRQCCDGTHLLRLSARWYLVWCLVAGFTHCIVSSSTAGRHGGWSPPNAEARGLNYARRAERSKDVRSFSSRAKSASLARP